jgi:hypothetical protein
MTGTELKIFVLRTGSGSGNSLTPRAVDGAPFIKQLHAH